MNEQFFRKGLEPATPEPFAHRDWRGALKPELYDELAASFPLHQFGDVLDKDNRVVRVDSRDLLGNPATPQVWRELIDYLTSHQFWLDVVRLFGADIRA